MLKYDNISYQIGNKEILSNINFELEEGKLTCLIGPNGSGKSTIIKMLNKPNSDYLGTIYYNDQQYQRFNFTSDIAILMQESRVPNHLTAYELVKLGLLANDDFVNKEERINRCFEMCEAEGLRNRMINSLSGGERKRVMICASLVRDPKLLILDEPTSFLDIKYQAVVLKLLKRLRDDYGVTILLVIHNLSHAMKVSDRVIAIKDGVIQFDENIANINKEMLGTLFEVEFANKREKHYNIKI